MHRSSFVWVFVDVLCMCEVLRVATTPLQVWKQSMEEVLCLLAQFAQHGFVRCAKQMPSSHTNWKPYKRELTIPSSPSLGKAPNTHTHTQQMSFCVWLKTTQAMWLYQCGVLAQHYKALRMHSRKCGPFLSWHCEELCTDGRQGCYHGDRSTKRRRVITNWYGPTLPHPNKESICPLVFDVNVFLMF